MSILGKLLQSGGNPIRLGGLIGLDFSRGVGERTIEKVLSGGKGPDPYISQRVDTAPEKAVRIPNDPVDLSKINTQPVSYSYPSDLSQDFRMTFEFMDYQRPTPFIAAKEYRKAFIHLPLARELYDVHSTRVDTRESGMIGAVVDAALTSHAAEQMETSGQEAAGGVRGAQAAARAAARGAQSARAVKGILSATLNNENIQRTAEQLLGAALNPNLSVFFGGPNLREFTLTWEFAPHSAEESKEIKGIVRQLRQSSLASMTFENSVGVLSYPQMCQITMKPDHIKYKKAMLRTVNVNYSSNGIPSFFQGTKEPTFIQLSMTFVELEYFLSEDFGGATGKGVNGQFVDAGQGLPGATTDALADLAAGAVGVVGYLFGADTGITTAAESAAVGPENANE